ncbi:MAG: Fur family transcriptional regulator [Rhodothalassiaceae bacterium]
MNDTVPISESAAIRPYARGLALLREAGLRPTRQRLALARLLFPEDGHRHVSAEALHEEATGAGMRMSLATVYNTLHQFTDAGLLRELVIAPGHAIFDTNISPHHHFYNRATGMLCDIAEDEVHIEGLPSAPDGERIAAVHVVIYTESDAAQGR